MTWLKRTLPLWLVSLLLTGVWLSSSLGQMSVSGPLSMPAGTTNCSTVGLPFASDTDTGFSSGGANILNICTGASVRVSVDASGNVGVNTTAQRAKLEVLGTGTANTNGDPMGEVTIVGPDQPFSNSSGNLFIQSNNALAADLGGSIALGARYTTGSTVAAQFATIRGAKENGTSANLDGYLAFGTRSNASGSTEKVRITSAGNAVLGAGEASASLTGNTFRGPNAAGTNIAGVTTTLQASLATGTGNAGFLALQGAASKNTTGTSAHTASTMVQIGNTHAAQISSTGLVSFPAQTYIDRATAGAGTAALATGVTVGQLTLQAENAITNTDSASLYVAGAAIKSTNVTATRVHGLLIDTLASVSTATTASAFTAVAPTGATNNYTAQFQSTLGTNILIVPGAALADATGDDICYDNTTKIMSRSSTSTCVASSARYKRDIESVDSALSILKALRPVSFTYRNRPTIPRYGLIAEEVQHVAPRLATAESVYYIDLIPLLIKAVQEQQAQIETLR